MIKYTDYNFGVSEEVFNKYYLNGENYVIVAPGERDANIFGSYLVNLGQKFSAGYLGSLIIVEIDHDNKVVFTEWMKYDD